MPNPKPLDRTALRALLEAATQADREMKREQDRSLGPGFTERHTVRMAARDDFRRALTTDLVRSLLDQLDRAEAALEEVRTAAAWRDDLDPKDRLRLCLVAARAALTPSEKED